MVNQVYLLPKSGITNNVLPSAPSVMQVRSLAVGQTVLQPNGVLATTPVMPSKFHFNYIYGSALHMTIEALEIFISSS